MRHLLSSSYNLCSAGYYASFFIITTQHVFRWYVMFHRHHITCVSLVSVCHVSSSSHSLLHRVPLVTVRHVSPSSRTMCSAGSVGYRTPCFIVSTLQSRIMPVTIMFHRHHTAYYLVFPWLPHDMFHYYHTTLSLCLFLHSALPRHHTEQKTLAMRTVRTNADETYLQTKGNKRRSNIKQKQQNVIMQWPLQPYIHTVKV